MGECVAHGNRINLAHEQHLTDRLLRHLLLQVPPTEKQKSYSLGELYVLNLPQQQKFC